MSHPPGDIDSASISFDPHDEVLAFSAAELRAHLSASPGSISVPVELGAGAGAGDGFELTVGPDCVRIAGDSSRGTLNGVYALLERLGWLWVAPGPTGTRFVEAPPLPEGVAREAASFPRRTLILGNDALHDNWREWFEFASRNRCNSVFFHDTPPSVLDRGGAARPVSADAIAADGKGWLFERWDADGPAIRAEAAKRGITLQFGGHHLPALLRRELFEAHPEWFPERAGRRDARYNLCTSNAAAMAEVRSRAVDFFRRFAGASVYHLWADDIVGGGWCECAACASYSPSDQALRATNAVAEALAEVDPSAVVAHLAYHDTIAPPTAVRPAPNVTALYAPRNRNYAFSIDDAACARNASGHFAELLGLRDTFAATSDALAVFEYYSDAILYKWLAPPNLRVLPHDARAYREAGVHDFGNLAVTPRPWPGPAWHAWWFARCAWNAGADPAAELRRFCAAAFAGDADGFVALFETLDAAYREFLDLGELERIPRHDVLDFSDTPRPALAAKARQLAESVASLNAVIAALPVAPAGLGMAFREELAVQLAAANHIATRVRAWDAALAGRREDAKELLTHSRFHLRALEDWDHAHTLPGYANLSRAMLRGARWHTDRIANLIEPSD